MRELYRRLLCVVMCLACASLLLAQNEELTWKKIAKYKGKDIAHATGFSIGTKGYVCFGNNKDDGNTVDCWEYDPQKDEWTRIAKFPGESRVSPVTFTINGKAYIVSGVKVGGQTKQETSEMWEYSPQSNSWLIKAELPGVFRSGSIGFSIAGKGYVAMGCKQNKFKSLCFRELWEYDPQKNEWIKKADFPEEGRLNAAVFTINGFAYVLLGGKSQLRAAQKTVWRYDAARNKWDMLQDFPGQSRMNSIGFSVSDKGYVYGGEGLLSRYQALWEYHPSDDSWILKQEPPIGGRVGTCSFVIKDTVYIGTGISQRHISGSRDFWSAHLSDSTVRVNYNAKILYKDESENQHKPLADQGVSLYENEKKVKTTKTNIKGEYGFEMLDVEGKYKVVLEKNENLKNTVQIAVAKSNGDIIKVLDKNADGLFEYELSGLALMEEEDIQFFDLKYFINGPEMETTVRANIYYAAGSSKLPMEGMPIVNQVILALNEYPNLLLEIESHTDSQGDDTTNSRLSNERAEMVVRYIAQNAANVVVGGIDPKRVEGKGYGETKIINRCRNDVECTDEKHMENRRTEFKFIKQPQ